MVVKVTLNCLAVSKSLVTHNVTAPTFSCTLNCGWFRVVVTTVCVCVCVCVCCVCGVCVWCGERVCVVCVCVCVCVCVVWGLDIRVYMYLLRDILQGAPPPFSRRFFFSRHNLNAMDH